MWGNWETITYVWDWEIVNTDAWRSFAVWNVENGKLCRCCVECGKWKTLPLSCRMWQMKNFATVLMNVGEGALCHCMECGK